jgi:hypothetical protein
MPKQINQQSSITFQAPAVLKSILEGLAFSIGLKRVVDDEERGNISLVVRFMIDYIVNDPKVSAEFAEWVKNRVLKALKP